MVPAAAAVQRRLRAAHAHLQGHAVVVPPPSSCLSSGSGSAEEKEEEEEDIFAVTPLTPRTHHPSDDPTGAATLGLSAEEASFFREHGFVVKRALVPRGELRPFVDELWERAPAPLDRSNPATWADVGERWQNTRPVAGWAPAQNRGSSPVPLPSYRTLSHTTENSEWRFHEMGFRPDFVAATSAHPNVMHMVELILGGQIKRPNANRWIYSIFPRLARGTAADDRGKLASAEPLGRLVPHIDSHPFQLGGVLYLSDTAARSGCNTLWPGSHRLLWPACEQEINFVPNEKFGTPGNACTADTSLATCAVDCDGGRAGDAMRKVRRTIQPVEIAASAGDMVFFHHRCVHSTGINTNPLSVRHGTPKPPFEHSP